MTGPVVPSDEDELREAMHDALAKAGWTYGYRTIADILLPVVLADRERYAIERAAEELRWRAAMIWTRAAQEDEAVEAALSETAAWLTARAAALTAREEAGR